jgi:hypothetical protein
MSSIKKQFFICFGIFLLITIGLVFSRYHLGFFALLATLIFGTLFTSVGVILGDMFRRFIHPDILIAESSTDMFKKRVLWMVGPQIIGWIIMFIGFQGFMTNVLGFDLSGKAQQVSQSRNQEQTLAEATDEVQKNDKDAQKQPYELNLEKKLAESKQQSGVTLDAVVSQVVEPKLYDSKLRENFVHSCTTTGSSENRCNCMLDVIQKSFTQDEFLSVENEMARTGKQPEQFSKVVIQARSECTN